MVTATYRNRDAKGAMIRAALRQLGVVAVYGLVYAQLKGMSISHWNLTAGLRMLCLLVDGELSVSQINERIALSQSALSQHLAKMREDGLVATRRDGQTIYYRIADDNAARLLNVLKDIYCP